MTHAASREAESIQLMTQATFHGIDSESTHDSSRSPRIDSNRLMTQRKKTFDSESTYDATLSRTHFWTLP